MRSAEEGIELVSKNRYLMIDELLIAGDCFDGVLSHEVD